MKKILLLVFVLFLSVNCMAQEELSFPFQGGRTIMAHFFKDSLIVSPDIILKKATGLVIFKFTADEYGKISKLVVYYADDLLLTPPVIEALRKSNRKWIIPDHEKFHDFIIPFSISFNIPDTGNAAVQEAYYNFYLNRNPILSLDQVPLNAATLLPVVVVKYDIP